MKNYFTTFDKNKESLKFYKNLSKKELIQILNMKFDNINDNVSYYAKLLKQIFKGSDYDEHYYNLLSIVEDVSDIKIIVDILKDGEYYG